MQRCLKLHFGAKKIVVEQNARGVRIGALWTFHKGRKADPW